MQIAHSPLRSRQSNKDAGSTAAWLVSIGDMQSTLLDIHRHSSYNEEAKNDWQATKRALSKPHKGIDETHMRRIL